MQLFDNGCIGDHMNTQKTIRFASAVMAFAASSVALGISYVAGTERGGLPAERAIWIGVGLVLALSAHLIPALLGRQPVARRIIGYGLWLACMVTTIGGHAQFFLQAQAHAGAVRAAAIEKPVAQGRDLIAVLDDRANTEKQIAQKQVLLASRYCHAGCASISAAIAGLKGHLAVIDAEERQAHKNESNQDRYEAKAEQASMDPVAVALSQFGVAPEKVQTVMSMVAALTLELVACLFWSISLSPLAALETKAAAAPEAAPVVEAPAPAPAAVEAPAAAVEYPMPFAPQAPIASPAWDHAVQIPMPSVAADVEAVTEERAEVHPATEANAVVSAETLAAMPVEERITAILRIARAEVAAGILKRSERTIRARFGGAREVARAVNRTLMAELQAATAPAIRQFADMC